MAEERGAEDRPDVDLDSILAERGEDDDEPAAAPAADLSADDPLPDAAGLDAELAAVGLGAGAEAGGTIAAGLAARVAGRAELTDVIREARDALMETLALVDQISSQAVGDEAHEVTSAHVAAWLSCMGELVAFCDRACGVLLGEAN